MTVDLNNLHRLPTAPSVADRLDAGELDAEVYNTYPAPGHYDDVADRVLADLFHTSDSVPTIRYWRNEWYRYTGTHWRPVHEDEVKKPVRARLRQVTYIKKTQDGEEHKPWMPSKARVGEVLEPLKLTVLTAADVEAPTWTGTGRAPGQQLIAMRNGLFDPHARELHSHTAQWFNVWSLPFDYDPQAAAPRWQRFLNEVFDHDPAAADLLQEWAGYLISGRIDLQKMLIVLGVPGAGKSVIDHVLTALMGGSVNVATPSMSDFGNRFALAQLRGKPLAIFGDAAADAGKDQKKVVERIKTITGCGAVEVEPKGKDIISVQLPTRFTIIANQTPKFLDASTAIQRRTVAMRLTKSFQDNPDKDLTTKLDDELSGIFMWALEGLDRLNENNGKFTTPTTESEVLEGMEELGSPIRTFFKEEYSITGEESDYIPLKEAYRNYTDWCEETGLARGRVSQNKFADDIRAMSLPGVKPGQLYMGDRVVRGITYRAGSSAGGSFFPKTR